MPSLAGHLTLRLHRRPGAAAQVEVISSRPQLADWLFQGKTPIETADLAERVFTLCGRAQRLAATAACAAAQSNYPSLSRESNHPGATRHPSLSKEGNRETTEFGSLQQAVLMETALEHAWRLLVDWPVQAGLSADMNRLRVLRQAAAVGPTALADALDAILETLPDAPLPLTPSHKGEGELKTPSPLAGQGEETEPSPLADQGGGTEPSPSPLVGEGWGGGLLPPLSKLNLAEADALAWRALEEPVFCTRPLWRNQPAETGALARQQDHPLLADRLNSQGCRISARWLARRLELAELPSRLRREPTDILLAQPLAENYGYAWVETARGALLHVAHLEQGRVTAYRIVAPTEWNFHPAGPFVAGMTALGEAADLAAAAQALALSLDPCVSYQVEVVNA